MATVRHRILQQTAWLRENFATPYPVVVEWAHKIAADPKDRPAIRESGYVGECYWRSPVIAIRLSKRLCRTLVVAQDTLNHEWAHAIVMPNQRVHAHRVRQGDTPEHPDEWALAYGRIYRAWIDDGGSDEARRLRV